MSTALIAAALAKLDFANDSHWTEDGLPRLEVVRTLAGDEALTRDALVKALPGFTRASGAAVAAPSPTPAPKAIAAPAQAQAAATPAQDGPPEQQEEVDPLAVANARLDVLRAKKNEADKEFAAQIAVVDALIIAREKTDAAQQSTPVAIQAYLAAQQQRLAQRSEQLVRVRKFETDAGVKLADMVPKRAPIDAAMSRKTARGANRPVKL